MAPESYHPSPALPPSSKAKPTLQTILEQSEAHYMQEMASSMSPTVTPSPFMTISPSSATPSLSPTQQLHHGRGQHPPDEYFGSSIVNLFFATKPSTFSGGYVRSPAESAMPTSSQPFFHTTSHDRSSPDTSVRGANSFSPNITSHRNDQETYIEQSTHTYDFPNVAAPAPSPITDTPSASSNNVSLTRIGLSTAVPTSKSTAIDAIPSSTSIHPSLRTIVSPGLQQLTTSSNNSSDSDTRSIDLRVEENASSTSKEMRNERDHSKGIPQRASKTLPNPFRHYQEEEMNHFEGTAVEKTGFGATTKNTTVITERGSKYTLQRVDATNEDLMWCLKQRDKYVPPSITVNSYG